MVYAKYGETFKILRKQRGYKLSAFEDVGISKSTLSKFERGDSMMSFDKLIVALEVISVTFFEFEKIINNFLPSTYETLLEKINTCLVSSQTDKFVSLYHEAQEIDEFQLALAVRGQYEPLSVGEVDELVDFFDNLKIWREVDLYTLYLSLEYLNTKEILYILEQFLVDGEAMFASRIHRDRFVHVAYRAVAFLVLRGYKELAYHILLQVDKNDIEHTFHTKNLRNLTEGYWISEFKDFEKGKKQMEDALKNFRDLGNLALSNYYQKLISKNSIASVEGNSDLIATFDKV